MLKVFTALCFEMGSALLDYSKQKTATNIKTAKVATMVSLILSSCLAGKQLILALSEVKELCHGIAAKLPHELQVKLHEMENKLDEVDHRKNEIDENEVERITSFFQELVAKKVGELVMTEIVRPDR